MSLDVTLVSEEKVEQKSSGIFIRENGQTKEISREEWNKRFPNREPVVVLSRPETNEVYSSNITHNLGKMASEAGIYQHLWRPEELGITKAKELIEPLKEGLKKLKDNPKHYEQFNASNGWGKYEDLVNFTENYLNACIEYPDDKIEVSR